MSNISNVKLITDDDLLKQGANIREPGTDLKETPTDFTAGKLAYPLLDNDLKVCRVINQDELKASYVDNNIQRCYLQDYTPFEETLDNEYLVVKYYTGADTSILFGLIDAGPEVRAEQYAKTGSIIYPIDDSGSLQLNLVNTPTLVYTRQWVLNEWKKANDQNLEMADLVDKFVKAGFDPVSESLGDASSGE
jgi:hypothetical protein